MISRGGYGRMRMRSTKNLFLRCYVCPPLPPSPSLPPPPARIVRQRVLIIKDIYLLNWFISPSEYSAQYENYNGAERGEIIFLINRGIKYKLTADADD